MQLIKLEDNTVVHPMKAVKHLVVFVGRNHLIVFADDLSSMRIITHWVVLEDQTERMSASDNAEQHRCNRFTLSVQSKRIVYKD